MRDNGDCAEWKSLVPMEGKNVKSEDSGSGRMVFLFPFVLSALVFLVLPHLRLQPVLVKWLQLFFVLPAVFYSLLGLVVRGRGRFFSACRSFMAASGVFFLLLNYLPVARFLALPLLSFDVSESREGVAVVLGGGVLKDGTPSEASRRRVVRAAQLYHEGRAKMILFSTGATSPGVISEAAAMARFARSLGVPRQSILLEEQSRNTVQNAKFSAVILKKRGIKRVFLVTDSTHMFRALESFRYHGIQAEPVPAVAKIHIAKVARGGWNLFAKVLHEYLGIVVYRVNRFLEGRNAG